MSVSTLFSRFTPARQKDVISLFVSVDQAVMAYSEGKDSIKLDVQSASQTDPWKAALALIAKHSITKADVHLVLGHGLYQSLLIDDPGLSDEDKRAALPFKLKDFISDSPSDIVADGFRSPVAHRFQAFVCHKLPLIQFSMALEKSQCSLTQVSLEDVALRQWTQLDKTEMVLSRDAHGVLQLAAFHLGKLCFQRQIRGVLLDGQMMPPLVIDDLALEVQRSLDYLRSQLKNAQVTGLVVSVQGVDDTELAFQLSSRLSVAVRPQQLFDQGDHYQHIATAALDRQFSPDVNLFSDDLAPQQPLLTFERMLVSWGVIALAVVLVAAYQQMSLSTSEKSLSLAKNEQQAANRLSESLNQQLALHVPSASLSKSINDKKQAIDARRSALDAVKQHDVALQQGYADTFTALAALSRNDVSVATITVNQHALDLTGLAATPSSVPSWLQTFSTQPALADRKFEQMTLRRDENNRLTFDLGAKRNSAESNQ